jgi:hypothetical protein
MRGCYSKSPRVHNESEYQNDANKKEGGREDEVEKPLKLPYGTELLPPGSVYCKRVYKGDNDGEEKIRFIRVDHFPPPKIHYTQKLDDEKTLIKDVPLVELAIRIYEYTSPVLKEGPVLKFVPDDDDVGNENQKKKDLASTWSCTPEQSFLNRMLDFISQGLHYVGVPKEESLASRLPIIFERETEKFINKCNDDTIFFYIHHRTLGQLKKDLLGHHDEKMERDNETPETRFTDKKKKQKKLRDSISLVDPKGRTAIHACYIFKKYDVGRFLIELFPEQGMMPFKHYYDFRVEEKKKDPKLAVGDDEVKSAIYRILPHNMPYVAQNVLHIAIIHEEIQEVNWLLQFYEKRCHLFPGALIKLLCSETEGTFFKPWGKFYFGGFPLLFSVCTNNVAIYNNVLAYARSSHAVLNAHKERYMKDVFSCAICFYFARRYRNMWDLKREMPSYYKSNETKLKISADQQTHLGVLKERAKKLGAGDNFDFLEIYHSYPPYIRDTVEHEIGKRYRRLAEMDLLKDNHWWSPFFERLEDNFKTAELKTASKIDRALLLFKLTIDASIGSQAIYMRDTVQGNNSLHLCSRLDRSEMFSYITEQCLSSLRVEVQNASFAQLDIRFEDKPKSKDVDEAEEKEKEKEKKTQEMKKLMSRKIYEISKKNSGHHALISEAAVNQSEENKDIAYAYMSFPRTEPTNGFTQVSEYDSIFNWLQGYSNVYNFTPDEQDYFLSVDNTVENKSNFRKKLVTELLNSRILRTLNNELHCPMTYAAYHRASNTLTAITDKKKSLLWAYGNVECSKIELEGLSEGYTLKNFRNRNYDGVEDKKEPSTNDKDSKVEESTERHRRRMSYDNLGRDSTRRESRAQALGDLRALPTHTMSNLNKNSKSNDVDVFWGLESKANPKVAKKYKDLINRPYDNADTLNLRQTYSAVEWITRRVPRETLDSKQLEVNVNSPSSFLFLVQLSLSV